MGKINKKSYFDHSDGIFVFGIQALNKTPEIIEFLKLWSDYFAKRY
jgi:hypothetical protein